MNFQMKGRIKESNFHQPNGKYYSVIDTPAKDEYSQPSSFKVQSTISLGPVGGVVSLHVSISGYVKKERWTDKITGEQKSMDKQVIFFDAELDQLKPAVKAS